MSMMTMANAQTETTQIPDAIRLEVDGRDQLRCRMCGKYLGDRRALHHIMYGGDAQGMGGRRLHEAWNLITVCWLPGDNGCHNRIHSNKKLWQPVALAAAETPGVTMLQIARWNSTGSPR